MKTVITRYEYELLEILSCMTKHGSYVAAAFRHVLLLEDDLSDANDAINDLVFNRYIGLDDLIGRLQITIDDPLVGDDEVWPADDRVALGPEACETRETAARVEAAEEGGGVN